MELVLPRENRMTTRQYECARPTRKIVFYKDPLAGPKGPNYRRLSRPGGYLSAERVEPTFSDIFIA